MIEVKYPEHGNLDVGCTEALRQLESGGYDRQPRLDGMDKIIKCGIACYVKNCKVVFAV